MRVTEGWITQIVLVMKNSSVPVLSSCNIYVTSHGSSEAVSPYIKMMGVGILNATFCH